MRFFSIAMAALLIAVTAAAQESQPASAPASQPTVDAPQTQPVEDAPVSEEVTVTTDSGLQYVDIVVGEGDAAAVGNTVIVHYTGWLANGNKFDSSHDRNRPFPVTLGERRVIAGWEEGLQGMQAGGKRRLIIPPDLGYGARGAGGVIPPNATLTFEVELLEIR